MIKQHFKPRITETEITGAWVKKDGKILVDENCERIEKLIAKYLIRIGDSKEYGGWKVLYQASDDKRFWELFYPQSDLHGGGPPSLRNISEHEAVEDYDLSKLINDAPWIR